MFELASLNLSPATIEALQAAVSGTTTDPQFQAAVMNVRMSSEEMKAVIDALGPRTVAAFQEALTGAF